MHQSQKTLRSRLDEAAKQVTVGGQYRHYKQAENIYCVLQLAVLEANNELCVIYQAQYGEGLTFVRQLVNWLETVEWEGQTVNRFSLIID